MEKMRDLREKDRKKAMNAQAAEKHCGHLQCDESPVGNTHTHTYTHKPKRDRLCNHSPQLCSYNDILSHKLHSASVSYCHI